MLLLRYYGLTLSLVLTRTKHFNFKRIAKIKLKGAQTEPPITITLGVRASDLVLHNKDH